MANPTFRLVEADGSARSVVGIAGRGCWKKPRPFRNGMDRDGSIVPPCKRADFQRVVRDEKAGRTRARRKWQMNVAQAMCASSGRATRANQFDWLKCVRPVSGLQVHIVKVAWEIPALAGSVHAGLCCGLSRMKICGQFCYVA